MIILAVTSVTLLFATAQGLKSGCSIPSVGTGETTTLTCKFDYDLKTDHCQFQVHRDNLRQSKSQETILFCGWKNGNPDCHTHPRVTFNRKVTDQIQLQLRNVTRLDEGRYECVMIPFSGDANTDCIFALKGPETSSVKKVFIESTKELQHIGESNGNLAGTPIHVITGVAVGSSVVSIIISVSITLLIIFCLWNRRFKNGSQTKHRYSENKNKPVDNPQSGAGIQETEHDIKLSRMDRHNNIGKRISQGCKLENDSCLLNLTTVDLERRTSTCSLQDLNLRYGSDDYDEPQQSLNASVVDLNKV